MLVLDADGVLTDGSITLLPNGDEALTFNVRDGFGIKLWQSLGGKVAIITGRDSPALAVRAGRLGISAVMRGVSDKDAAIDRLAEELGVGPEAMAFLGDDWPDLPAMRRVGYPMAVADAEPEVIAAAFHVTARPGGRGAIRDAVAHLLSARGLYAPPQGPGLPRAL